MHTMIQLYRDALYVACVCMTSAYAGNLSLSSPKPDRLQSPIREVYAQVRTFEVQLPPGDMNVASTTINPYGHIRIGNGNDTTTGVRRVQKSHGVELDSFSANRVEPQGAEISESYTIFEGPLGIYGNQAVMYLTNTDGQVSGSYFYARHGRDLTLEGQVDPATGRGTMTEVWDGKITGYFDFAFTDAGMRGTWRATPDSEAQSFAFKALHFPDRTFSEQAAALNGFYCRTFESWIYVDGDTPDALPKEQKFQAWDWLRVRHVGGDVLSFYYHVMAGNGHQGVIGGWAHMTSAGTAEFTATDGLPGRPRGRLGFEFDGDTVTITELEDCSYYRGARAHFDGTLKRADEHAVQLPAETAAAP